MPKFCIYCGKQLAEGEACACEQSRQAQANPQGQVNEQAQAQFYNQQVPPQNQWQNQQQVPPQDQWQGQQPPQGQWGGQQQVPPQGQWQQQAPPQGQWPNQQPPQGWQGQPGYYYPPRQPNPNGLGNRLEQLFKEFFVAPVNAIVNQVKRGSLSVAFLLLGITAGVRFLIGLIQGLEYKLVVRSMFYNLLDEVFFLGAVIFGLFLFTMAFTKRSLNLANAVVAVGCASLLLPVAYILALIPTVGDIFSESIRFFAVILSVLSYHASEGVEDKNKTAYVALITVACYYVLILLLNLIFGYGRTTYYNSPYFPFWIN